MDFGISTEVLEPTPMDTKGLYFYIPIENIFSLILFFSVNIEVGILVVHLAFFDQ